MLPQRLTEPIRYRSHRDFVRQVLRDEVDLSAAGTEIVPRERETAQTRAYRDQVNADGSPSETVAAGYVWTPGSELARRGNGSGNGARSRAGAGARRS